MLMYIVTSGLLNIFRKCSINSVRQNDIINLGCIILFQVTITIGSLKLLLQGARN